MEVHQSEAELIRPQGEGAAQAWGGSAHHWGAKLGKGSRALRCAYNPPSGVGGFCLGVGEEAFPFRKPRAYVLGNSEGNTVGAQAG